jgi:hypothetical protein
LRALALVDAGWSWAEAAREVGVAKGTVGTWVRSGVPRILPTNVLGPDCLDKRGGGGNGSAKPFPPPHGNPRHPREWTRGPEFKSRRPDRRTPAEARS